MQVANREVRWMQSHDLQKVPFLVLLALREEVHQTSLSLLQLLWVSRNAVRKLEWGLLRTSQANRPVPAPTLRLVASSAMLPHHGPSIHHRILDHQTFFLVRWTKGLLRDPDGWDTMLPEWLLREADAGLAVVATSSTPLRCFHGPAEADSDDVRIDVRSVRMMVSIL